MTEKMMLKVLTNDMIMMEKCRESCASSSFQTRV